MWSPRSMRYCSLCRDRSVLAALTALQGEFLGEALLVGALVGQHVADDGAGGEEDEFFHGCISLGVLARVPAHNEVKRSARRRGQPGSVAGSGCSTAAASWSAGLCSRAGLGSSSRR